MRKNNYDVLIVGQGIAGTVLAHNLTQHGKSILIIDDPKLSASSRISGGMYNPVVFKRLTKSWMVDELIDVLIPFYNEVEKNVGMKLLFPKEIVKIFSEEQERVLWEKKINEEVGKYLLPSSDEIIKEFGTNKFGHGTVTGAGYVNVQQLLAFSVKYFEMKGMYLHERFEHSKLKLENDGVLYKEHAAKRIIFCEGYRCKENPYFNWIPFKFAKGELLMVKMDGYHFDRPVNKGVFIGPAGHELYGVGSTFNWKDINDDISEEGKNELLIKLKKATGIEAEVVEHKAGVRPSIIDRRPVLGMHPEHKHLAIFNGMGSKGVMLAPYFAEHLYQHLFEGRELNREVDIKRFN